MAGHVEHNLSLIADTNAKTDPASYTASGQAEAFYGDGRQANLPLAEVRTETPDDLVSHIRSWAQEQFQKLAALEP